MLNFVINFRTFVLVHTLLKRSLSQAVDVKIVIMETTSYPTMEYSLSDIQLPDPPKEKDKTGVTLNKSSKGVNSSSKSEKNHAPKNEGQTTLTSNSVKEESNSNSQKVCDPESPQTCVISEDSKKENSESETNVSEELKNSLKEVNRHTSKETLPTVDQSPEVKEVNSKNNVINEVAISEDNCDAANDTKQGDAKVDSKKSSNSSSSSNSKMKEQRSRSKKRESADSAAKEKDSHNSQNTDRDDSAVDKESAKIVRKRKNRRTSRSSSRSSSSESSSSNSSSPERESSRSKKSGKSGSSSEGIASPSSSGSSSGSESENDKKSPLKEKLKAGKTDGVEDSEGVVKQRRKINRNLSIKGFQETTVTKDTEMEDVQEPSTTSHKVKKEDTEKNDETSKKTEVREIKFTPRKLSLTSLKSNEKLEGQDSEKSNSKQGAKKRKWGNCTAALPKASVSISSDSLKTLIPDLKPFTVAPVLSDQEDLSNPVDMESPPKKEPKIVNLPVREEMVVEEVPTHSQTDKTSSITDTKDLPSESVQVSPAHNPTSNIIFIKNLVRPFTLLQLKELLKQTGKMIDERFWIDKIKSKCIVVYETEEQAVATRNVLHGTRWPLSNPKILSVDFSTEEELDAHRNMTEYPKPAKVTLHALEKQEIKETQTVDVPKRKNREEHRRDKDRQKLPVTHVREWDKDKLTQDSPDQTSHRAEKDTEKSRSDKRKEKKDSKRRVDDDAPAKLLDDLFRKTRASPCIYWLPLTEEQAKQREEERQARRMEREKRWQQRKEQEESERRNRAKGHSGREKESRRSQSRSRSPQGRRR